MQEYWIEGYTVRVNYLGDKPSPFDPQNMNNHAITIRNRNHDQVTINYWGATSIKNEGDATRAFRALVHTAAIGAMPPDAFCALLGIHTLEISAEKKFLAAREITQQMVDVVKEDWLALMRRLV